MPLIVMANSPRSRCQFAHSSLETLSCPALISPTHPLDEPGLDGDWFERDSSSMVASA